MSLIVGGASGQVTPPQERTKGPFEVVAIDVVARWERPEVLRASAVIVTPERLNRLSPGEAITLNVAEDVRYRGLVERVVRRGADRLTLSGRLPDVERGSFLLIVEEGVVAGIVRDPSASLLYHVRHRDDGTVLIEEIDTRRFPPESAPVVVDQKEQAGSIATAERILPSSGGPDLTTTDGSSACSNTSTIFDVLVVWTPKARQAIGGATASRAEALAAIDEANTTYRNSGINARMRLVHTAEVAYDENGTGDEHLARLVNPIDGIMDQVHALRNSYRADFVNLFIDDTQTAGIGSCSAGVATAFSVARWDLAAANYTLAHEIGHNMGCGHNREDAGAVPCGTQPYAFGWRWTGNSGDMHSSVMSYPDGGTYTRVPYFSNPDVSFDGQPTGVPIGAENQSHNTAAINLSPWFYEAFHITRYDVWVDFAALPLGNGTFQLPYNNVTSGVDETVHGSGASDLPTLWIKAGSSSELTTIRKSLRLQACGGTVRIGATP